MFRRFSSSTLSTAALFVLSVCGSATAGTFQAAPGDFNQDGRTDMAVLHSGERIGNQTRYRLEVFPGGARQPVILDNFEAAWASKIVARDLDGDHDADLVLFSASGTPTKVWINDGAGNLHAEDPSTEIRSESSTVLLPGTPVVTLLHWVVVPTPNVLPRPGPADERVSAGYDRFVPASAGPFVSCLTAPLFKRPPPAAAARA